MKESIVSKAKRVLSSVSADRELVETWVDYFSACDKRMRMKLEATLEHNKFLEKVIEESTAAWRADPNLPGHCILGFTDDAFSYKAPMMRRWFDGAKK